MQEKNYTKGRTSVVAYSENAVGDVQEITTLETDIEDVCNEEDLQFLKNDSDFPWHTYIALPLDVLAPQLKQLGVTFDQGYPTYEQIEEQATLHFNSNQMKLSLDLHGVLDDLPGTMKMLMEAVVLSGGEVHILTGSTTEKAKKELSDLGFEYRIHFTHVMGLPDWLEERGYASVGVDPIYGNKMYSDEDWYKGKALYCWWSQIDLHLDDTIEYGEHFTTPFARLWTKNK